MIDPHGAKDKSDRGASMILVAMSLLLLIGASAVAVDLAAIRLDRSADQKVTDSAASAGALTVLDGTGVDACEDALAYVAINAQEIGTIDSTGCAGAFVAPSCDSVNPAPESHAVSIPGRYEITVTYPVPNGHDLMTSGQLGAPTQAVIDDGDPCKRVGVSMSATRSSLFAQLLGFNEGTTTVHSVAVGFLPSEDGPPLNLVVLDRHDCQALRVEGNGGVIVNAVIDPDSGEPFPGLAAADSDGLSGIDCTDEGDPAGVIHIKGNGSTLRSDGPPGCPDDDLSTPLIGEGCGLIQVFASGPPGCNFRACTPGAGGGNPPTPEPGSLPTPLTRAQIDYEYNCWPDYTWTTSNPGGVSWATDPLTTGNGQDIPGCTEGTPDHIYDLLGSVGPNGRAGHAAWNADPPTMPCQVTSSQSFSTSGPTWVDCDDFIVEGNVTIDGNVIFQGNVHVSSHGRLEINTSDGWTVFRGQHSVDGTGRLKKDGQASLVINRTAVYFSKNSWVDISGGSGGSDCADPSSAGLLSWTAPESGALEDLALWSDSPMTHFWAGQGNLDMRGVFFTPLARADYAGTSCQNQTEAQWVARKLTARGQGELVIQPDFSFPFKRDTTKRTILIR